MKRQLKSLVVRTLRLPTDIAQAITSAAGIYYSPRGAVFDDLLEQTKTVSTKTGKKITFHTPNWLTTFRANTLLTKEPETLEWIDSFGPNSVLWDIGANVGVYSLYSAVTHPDIQVIAIEPSIENTYLLNRNISTNKLADRILAFPFALSETSGPNLFKHTTLQLGGAMNSFGVDYSFDGKPADFTEQYRVFGFRMDDLPSVFGIPLPTHIKIDVDGIEHLIARGGREVFSSTSLKSVLIELNFGFPEQRDEIMALFQEYGLRLREYRHADQFYGTGSLSGIYNHIFERA